MNPMNVATRKELACVLALILLSALLLGLQLGEAGLIDPDEPFYSLTAKEMLQRRDPWTPWMFGAPQFEKPIFFYWVLYASFRLFGISEFSARLGPCIAGMLTVLVVYLWGRLLFKRRRPAFLAAAILASSGQFIVLSRVVLTDIFLCLFVTSALCAFSWGFRYEKARPVAWHLFFVFCALGFLTKGPLGFLIPFSAIAVWAPATGRRWVLARLPWAGGLALFSLVALPWYAFMTKLHGPEFLRHFFVHENVRRFFVAEHRGMDRWFFYPGVVLLGFFPWSAFALAGAADAFKRRKGQLFLACAFFAPFIFFMLAKSKLMSYVFPMYPALALLAGSWAWKFGRALGMGFAPSRLFFFLSVCVWGFAPAALSAAAVLFAERADLPILAPLAAISAVLVPFSWISLYLLHKRKPFAAMAAMLAMTVIFSGLSFGWMMPKAGLAFSSRRWARDYRRLSSEEPAASFMASKYWVRGMTFYTGDKNIGVFSSRPDGGFYTPHPIRIVSDGAEFSKMGREAFPVYFLIRPKEFGHLLDNLQPDLSVSIVKAASQRILVRLDRV